VTNYNSKFLTKEIVGAQNLNLILKFVEKGSALSFIILDKIFWSKIFLQLEI